MAGSSTASSTSWLSSITANAVHSFSSLSSKLPAAAAATAGGAVLFSEMGMGAWFVVDLAINWAGWAVSSVLRTEKFYDLLGSLSFVTLTAGSLALGGPIAPRKVLVSCLVGAWAVRLGTHLVVRVHKAGKDSRFDEVKHQPGMFLFYWTMQAVWVWVTLTPVLVINCAKAATPLAWWDLAGALLWAAGLGIEAVADAQKSAWRERPENKGKFINEGLWAVSRHPNYLGEMMLWWGMFFVCAGGFTRPQHLASLASPLFVMFVLRNMSGVPILERQADARWGGQADYEAYKAATPMLVPDLRELLKGKATHTS